MEINWIAGIVRREKRVRGYLILPISPRGAVTVHPLDRRFLAKRGIHHVGIDELIDAFPMVKIVENPAGVIDYHIDNNVNVPGMSMRDEFQQVPLGTPSGAVRPKPLIDIQEILSIVTGVRVLPVWSRVLQYRREPDHFYAQVS